MHRADQLLPLIDLFEDRPVEQRFQMIQELERLIRDLETREVDWAAGTELVRQAAAQSKDAAEFREALRRIAADNAG